MRIHSLLIALTVSAFTVSAMSPWMAVAQKANETVDENGVLTLAGAQQTAAKITMRSSNVKKKLGLITIGVLPNLIQEIKKEQYLTMAKLSLSILNMPMLITIGVLTNLI
jgi:hypothetical protein